MTRRAPLAALFGSAAVLSIVLNAVQPRLRIEDVERLAASGAPLISAGPPSRLSVMGARCGAVLEGLTMLGLAGTPIDVVPAAPGRVAPEGWVTWQTRPGRYWVRPQRDGGTTLEQCTASGCEPVQEPRGDRRREFARVSRFTLAEGATVGVHVGAAPAARSLWLFAAHGGGRRVDRDRYEAIPVPFEGGHIELPEQDPRGTNQAVPCVLLVDDAEARTLGLLP